MTKNTMGTKLPRKLEQKMSVVGEQIKLARLRRNLSVAQIAERATCSPCVPNRERCINSSNRNLLASAVCLAA